MSRKVAFVVERADRLDRVVAAAPGAGLSRRRARTLIGAGGVFVDGRRCRVAGREVPTGARIVAHLDTEAGSTPQPPPPVLWQGGDLFAIAKPPGLHVNETETSALASVVSSFEGPVHPVHRLDRYTSGVLLLARTAAAAAEAAKLFERRAVDKHYWAVTLGRPTSTRIDAALGQDRRRPRARAVRADGKPACTELEVLGVADGLAAVRARPITGRTHQVRVHLAHASAPIAGDLLYGGPAASRLGTDVIRWPRVMLHAAALRFSWEGQTVSLTAALPADFEGLETLGLPSPGRDP